MAKLQLTQDDVEYLRELRYVGAGKIYLESQRRLERAGLITIHKGRFGEYVRLAPDKGSAESATPACVEDSITSPRFASGDRTLAPSSGAYERKAMIRTAKRIKKHQR